MKVRVPFEWLLEYLDTDLSIEQLEEKLPVIGIEVEEVISSAGSEFLEIGHIEAVEPHPSASSLNICTVNGKQIICGALNVYVGMKSILALPGYIVPSDMTKIRVAKIRGIESFGMLCSKKELLLSDEGDGIIDIEKDFSGSEEEIIRKISSPNGPILVLSINANRFDLMNIYGLARELSCFGYGVLKSLPPVAIAKSPLITNPSSLLVASDSSMPLPIALDNCSHNSSDKDPILSMYATRGNFAGNTPAWLKRRLFDAGLSHGAPLSDIAAYITHSFGQQLEFFNSEGESAGCVIEGINASPTPITDGEFLICAPRYKNKRNVSEETSKLALQTAIDLVKKISPAEFTEIVVLKAADKRAVSIKMPDTSFIVGDFDMHKILTDLGFQENSLGEYTQPEWRMDISNNDEGHLIEEILRHTGYEAVAGEIFWCENADSVDPYEVSDIHYIAYFLSKLGMMEINNLDFATKEMCEIFSVDRNLILANPMKGNKHYALRNSLLSGIIETLASYFRNNWNLSGIYEIGKIFSREEEGEALAMAIMPKNFYQWYLPSDELTNYFKAKNIFETCLQSAVPGAQLVQSPSENKILKNSCCWSLNGVVFAEFGELDMALFSKLFPKSHQNELVYLGEISLDKIKKHSPPFADYTPTQSTLSRDICISFTESKHFSEAIVGLKEFLTLKKISFAVFDVYPSPALDEQSRSVTMRFTWMLTYTPTTEEIGEAMTEIESILVANGCIIRGK